MTPRSAARLVPLAALVLLLAAPAAAQFVPAAPPAEGPAAPPSEGIHVHGKWTVTVSDPDGSVADRYEFQNALTLQGATLLTAVLLPEVDVEVNGWAIRLDGGSSQVFIDSAQTLPAGSDLNGLVVSGSAPSPSALTVDRVSTLVLASSGGGSGTSFTFTTKDLDTPIPVEADQTVDVRVEISFE